MKYFFQILFKSLVFSIILNGTSLYIFTIHSSISEVLYSEHDEYLYLPESLEYGGLSLNNIKMLTSISGIKDPRVDQQPHRLIKILLGKIGYAAGFSILSFNIFLDLIFCALSFLLFNLTFNKIFLGYSDQKIFFFNGVDFLTLLFLAQPWLINPLFIIDTFLLPSVDNYSKIQLFGLYPQSYPCIPVMRSVNTQASYPLIALSLFFLFSKRSLYGIVLSGLLAGSLIYVYFFSWIFLSSTAAIFLIINSRAVKNTLVVKYKYFLIFTGCFVLISIPGLVNIFESSLSSTYQIPSEVPKFIFVSPLLIIVAFIIGLKGLKKNSLSIDFFLSLLISTSIIMNIQVVTGKLLTPYHFLLFYAVPFLSVHSLAAIIDKFQKKSFLKHASITLLFCVFAFKIVYQHFYTIERFYKEQETIELIDYIKSLETDNEVFAMFPYSDPSGHWWSIYPSLRTTPYYIQYLSEKPIFPFNYEYINQEEQLYINYMIYNLFRGDNPNFDNYVNEVIYYPDFAYGIMSFEAMKRRIIRHKFENSIEIFLRNFSLPFKVRYLIVEPLLYPQFYDYVRSRHKEIWRSSENRYVLFVDSFVES
ncbi:MAG TPA: hypothetical protein PKA63_03000 [Oligoflexia bacterium]|mgnify:CR=1 FL=1|nr:hypothetical protein [Oligoflexia bacterium]HMP47622.1 hypothetical protein [Oligoflexia bacterium]